MQSTAAVGHRWSLAESFPAGLGTALWNVLQVAATIAILEPCCPLFLTVHGVIRHFSDLPPPLGPNCAHDSLTAGIHGDVFANWALQFIDDLLAEITHSGPAGLLDQDPRGILAKLAYFMFLYWDTINETKKLVKCHPALFPEIPSPQATPEIAVEPAVE